MKKDYAKTAHMNAWLRHPVLGDPSFDTFERLGETVHTGAPPFEWPVNGSVFRDFDGTWYFYAALYDHGCACKIPAPFKIYRSKDKGENWEDLGLGIAPGIRFDGDNLGKARIVEGNIAHRDAPAFVSLLFDGKNAHALIREPHLAGPADGIGALHFGKIAVDQQISFCQRGNGHHQNCEEYTEKLAHEGSP